MTPLRRAHPVDCVLRILLCTRRTLPPPRAPTQPVGARRCGVLYAARNVRCLKSAGQPQEGSMNDWLTESYRQHLPATRDLIADRDRWTTGALALAADGVPCAPHRTDACAWCLVGAFIRVTGIFWAADAENVLTELLGRLPSVVNDREGHPAVLALLDRAIRAGS